MSGGRATVALRKGIDLSNQAGDLIAIDKMGVQLTGKFFIECKHRRDLNYERFFLFGKGKIGEFWKKARQQAKAHGRDPMMIVRGNGKPTLLIVAQNELKYCCCSAVPAVTTLGHDVYLFDDVMKTQFNKQFLPRYMLKEGVNDKPIR